MLAGQLQKFGPSGLRRWLVDAAIVVFRDDNLRRMRDIINTMDRISTAIFREKKNALQSGMETQIEHEGRDIMSILRVFFVHP